MQERHNILMGKRPPRSIRKSETRNCCHQRSYSTLTRISQSQYKSMPVKKDSEQHYYKTTVPSNTPAKHSATLNPGIQNIEREMLAVLFGLEQFHYYAFGRPVTVESDHKPLESIFKKHLNKASPRLSRMLLRIQKYNVNNQVHTRKKKSHSLMPYLV